MNRLGCEPADIPLIAEALKRAQHVTLEGFLTHYASSEVVDGPALFKQSEAFEDAAEVLHGTGLRPEIMHMANSAAVVSRHESWKQMVRPGLSLYGYSLPFTSVVSGMPHAADDLPVKPVLSWKTRIFNLREVEVGAQIGYNGAFIARSPMRIAAIPVGYADGLNRQLSSRARVVVRNDYAAMIGNISMDITLLDVTGIPGVSIGDEVTLISGFDPDEDPNKKRISAWEHASHAGTIPYEILCNISKRVPRVYL
jgi:alanine racemase